jgi:MerR family copper efflux transcriptional regulator
MKGNSVMNAMTIGQAAQRSGVPPKTIRYYESIGLVRPTARGENNYRSYGEEEVEFLRFINRARKLGFSLKEVEQLIALYRDRSRTSRDVKALALRHVDDIERKIAELTSIRDVIKRLADRCRGDERPECPIIENLAPGASSHKDPKPPMTKRGRPTSTRGHSRTRI